MASKNDRINRYVLKTEEAEVIASLIIDDLKSRGVLGEIWEEELLLRTQKEIEMHWAKIIRQQTNRFGRAAENPRPALTVKEAKEIIE